MGDREGTLLPLRIDLGSRQEAEQRQGAMCILSHPKVHNRSGGRIQMHTVAWKVCN